MSRLLISLPRYLEARKAYRKLDGFATRNTCTEFSTADVEDPQSGPQQCGQKID